MLEDYPEFLTPHDVADLLELSVNTIYKMLRDGKLPGMRLGEKKWRVRKPDLERYFREVMHWW